MQATVIGVTGWKNSGKTTLVVALVAALRARGLRVATLKHASHSFDIDHEGRDSDRHRRAGALEVIVSSPKRWAQIRELETDEEEATLGELLSRLSSNPDIVVVEGYKSGPQPKICVHRADAERAFAPGDFANVMALVTDDADVDSGGLPVFAPDDAEGLVDFVIERTGMRL